MGDEGVFCKNTLHGGIFKSFASARSLAATEDFYIGLSSASELATARMPGLTVVSHCGKFRSVCCLESSFECSHRLQRSAVRTGWLVRSLKLGFGEFRSVGWFVLVTLYPTEPPVTGLPPVCALSLAHSPTFLPQLAFA